MDAVLQATDAAAGTVGELAVVDRSGAVVAEIAAGEDDVGPGVERCALVAGGPGGDDGDEDAPVVVEVAGAEVADGPENGC